MNLVILLLVLCVSCSDGGRVIYYADVDNEPGTWSTWFNTDNPFIYDRKNPGGDMETMRHVTDHEGRHCDWGVQCTNPIAMELDLSDDHKRIYPGANLEEVLNCTYIRPEAMKPKQGFYCLNQDQQNMKHSTSCLKKCKKNGQMDYGDRLSYSNGPDLTNCDICADFKVRFFCLESAKNCITAEEWRQMLIELEEYLENEIGGNFKGNEEEPKPYRSLLEVLMSGQKNNN